MPDWCSNRFTVRGADGELAAFAATVAGETSEGAPVPLRFGSIRPRPAWLDADAKDSPLFDPATGPKISAILADENLSSRERDQAISIAALGVTHPNDWSVAFWGTKWDLSEASLERRQGALVYDFGTAWSPPVEWVCFAAERFPALSLELVYAGNGFAGRVRAQGSAIADEDWSDDPGAHLRAVDCGDLWYDDEEDEEALAS